MTQHGDPPPLAAGHGPVASVRLAGRFRADSAAAGGIGATRRRSDAVVIALDIGHDHCGVSHAAPRGSGGQWACYLPQSLARSNSRFDSRSAWF